MPAHHRLAVLCLTSALWAQCPPGATMPNDLASRSATPTAQSPAAARWRAGQEALRNRQTAVALQHLQAALEFHPNAPALLADLTIGLVDDADALAHWSERLVRAASDSQARWAADPQLKRRWAGNKPVEAAIASATTLAMLRGQAITEVARLVERHKAQGKQGNASRAVLVRWLAELLLELGEHAPLALAAHTNGVGSVMASFAAEHEVVLQALLRCLGDADTARAQRAARILLGLVRQSRFHDLQGPAPRKLDDVAAAASRALQSQRTALAAHGKVWTIAELEAMDEAARVAFSAAHQHWHQPGIALSPNGRYRIETVCGHGTLLGVATTVEQHHQRLVAHYGKDPFVERQGLVRIVPEHSDLESEGAPFWWAGGFQAGDTTTLRFAWGQLPGLGRGLTHELTHRFDGVLHAFVGAWYTEGHASWTGAHYGRTSDTEFTENHLDLGSVARTAQKGYGDRARLLQLLRGEIEEYRDNYFAGYTLYAFLRGHPPGGKAPYRSALERYERGARAGQKDPAGWFQTCCCDGQQGRAATFDEFVAQWQAFLSGVTSWLADPKLGPEWVARYGELPPGENASLVLDEPTWSWARHRAEPFFGQDHASAAAQLLHEAGDANGAIAAGLWALEVDGWRPSTVQLLLANLAPREPAAARALWAIARQRLPQLPSPQGLPEDAASRLLPKVMAYAEALATKALALDKAGAKHAAAELLAERMRLASKLGAMPAESPLPNCPPALPEWLPGNGLSESGLTGYEDRREAGLWFATGDGDLHVGRKQAREGTGTLDPTARHADAFVHTAAFVTPGSYLLRGRVHCTTATVHGAMILGHTRRDRNLRLQFQASELGSTNASNRKLRLQFEGLWERDGQLPHGGRQWTVDLDRDQHSFDYELLVHGARVVIRIAGQEGCVYTMPDGMPIEGHVGFATSLGAIRVQQPTLQRLDRAEAAAVGLNPAQPTALALEELLQRPTRGFPQSRTGTLVLWLSHHGDDSPFERLPRALPVLASLLQNRHEFPQPWVLALPEGLPAEARQLVQRQVAELRGEAVPELQHRVAAPLVSSYPWVLFLDDQGILRAAAEVSDVQLWSRVQPWARMFRGR